MILVIQLKNGHWTWIDIFQRRHADGQRVHETGLHIINHQGTANQNRSEISPLTC